MIKIGRNDPCPSGAGKKFKKCLAAHPCLGSHGSAADIWWACERWQAQAPPLDELRAAMTAMNEVCPAKLGAFLDLVFDAPPSEIAFWRTLIMQCVVKEYPGLPELYRRMSDHLATTGDPELPWLYSATAICLREDHPEMFPEVLAATLALDPASTSMESLENLVEWAVELDRMDDCELLRQRFPEFPEYVIAPPEDADEPDDSDQSFEPDFPPDVQAALDLAWDDFAAVESPTPKQAEAFVEKLLALPHEATSWSEVFAAILRVRHIDKFKTFHRLAAALSPTRNKDFAFVCWAAVEDLQRLKKPECLPEIARALLDFDPHACDPDALSHIADALLANGFVDQVTEIMTGFLPSLRDNEDVMPWVVPRVAEQVFLLRLGTLIATGDYSRQSIDPMIAGLCVGLDDDIDEESASVPLRYLMQDKEDFSREQFMLPSCTKKPAEQKIFWNHHQQAFVEIARDEWQTENRNPSRTLIGLHMILRAAESWINSHSEKRQKYPPNLLDYLNSTAMDRILPIECADMLGVNLDRASIMCDACLSLIRWAGRHGLLAEKDAEKDGQDMARLMKDIGI